MDEPHSNTNAYDHLMKILIIGDSGSNKRRVLSKYLRDEELTDTTTLGENHSETRSSASYNVAPDM